MEQFVVDGGVRLSGQVAVSGAKNAVLKLMAACLLAPGEYRLSNVPGITDVATMMGVLRGVGAEVEWTGPGELLVQVGRDLSGETPDELVRTMRASVQVMGPIVARLGYVRLTQPGGCAIGERPLDLHLHGLEAMGAQVTQEGGYIVVRTPRLTGATVVLDFPSVGATENLMMAATLARGRTVIHNAAREPEVVELQEFLKAMGASVTGAGTPVVEIEGGRALSGTPWRLMPDRIETATWMVAAAITGGHLTLAGARPDHVAAIATRLELAGARVRARPDGIEVWGPAERPRAISIRTQPYPGFPTDAHPLWTSLMCVAKGTSVIREEIYSHRFRYAQELWRMGADITIDGRIAVVRGVPRLTGAQVEAPDLRGAAALLLAALAAEGRSVLANLDHLDRGYEKLSEKLDRMGARVRRKAA